MESIQLGNGIEDDLAGKRSQLLYLVFIECHAVGMDFFTESLITQSGLIQGTARGTVHVLTYEIEQGPGGKTFQRQQASGIPMAPDKLDFFQVVQQAIFIDQVVRSFHQ